MLLTSKTYRSYSWCGDGYKYERGKSSPFGGWGEREDDDDFREPIWDSGDIIGCGYNSLTSEVFYTRNGVFVGAYQLLTQRGIGSNLSVVAAGVGHRDAPPKLYPVVALTGPREKIYVNFGQFPFLWDFSFRTSPANSQPFTVMDYFDERVERSAGLWYLIDQCLDHTEYQQHSTRQRRSRSGVGEQFKRALPKGAPSRSSPTLRRYNV